MAIHLPRLPLQPIPNDAVDIHVRVDRERCTPPHDLARFDNTWQTFSIFELLSCAALQSVDSPRVVAGETPAQARLSDAWFRLWDWNPHAEHDRQGHRRLMLDAHANPDRQGDVTELLGNGLGIALAQRVLRVPLSAFTRRNFSAKVRQDFDVTTPTGIVWLENRGRFERNHLKNAIEELDAKFENTPKTRSYQRCMAAITCPSTKLWRTGADVELMDPAGDPSPPTREEEAKAVARYYRAYASRLGLSVGSYFDLVQEMPVRTLGRSIRERRRLVPDYDQQPWLWGTHEARISKSRYVGIMGEGWSALDSAAARTGVRPPQFSEGGWFLGLWLEAARSLSSYDLYEFLAVREGTETALVDGSVYCARFTDGSVFAASSSMRELKRALRLTEIRV